MSGAQWLVMVDCMASDVEVNEAAVSYQDDDEAAVSGHEDERDCPCIQHFLCELFNNNFSKIYQNWRNVTNISFSRQYEILLEMCC